MSLKASKLVWDYYHGPAPAKLVALCLADHADDNMICWPSVRRIAKCTGLSEAQARRWTHRIIAAGVFDVIGNAAGGSPSSTRRYRLILTPPADATPDEEATPVGDARKGLHSGPEGLHPRAPTPRADATRTGIESSEPSRTGAPARGRVVSAPPRPGNPNRADVAAFAVKHDGEEFVHDDGRVFQVTAASGLTPSMVRTEGEGAAPLDASFLDALAAGRIARRRNA